jgi:hypothetical protein
MIPTTAPPLPMSTPAKSSAVKAGWICLLLGYLTFWIFGFGFLFFSVTIILSIVAMCTNQVQQGIILLISSIASIAICVLIFFALIVGSIGAAANKASKDLKSNQNLNYIAK